MLSQPVVVSIADYLETSELGNVAASCSGLNAIVSKLSFKLLRRQLIAAEAAVNKWSAEFSATPSPADHRDTDAKVKLLHAGTQLAYARQQLRAARDAVKADDAYRDAVRTLEQLQRQAAGRRDKRYVQGLKADAKRLEERLGENCRDYASLDSAARLLHKLGRPNDLEDVLEWMAAAHAHSPTCSRLAAFPTPTLPSKASIVHWYEKGPEVEAFDNDKLGLISAMNPHEIIAIAQGIVHQRGMLGHKLWYILTSRHAAHARGHPDWAPMFRAVSQAREVLDAVEFELPPQIADWCAGFRPPDLLDG